MRTVCIDPGHGGRDPGATAGGIDEAIIVLDVCCRLWELLRGKVVVVMTRKDDTYLDLRARSTTSNLAEADVFCSVHCNSAHNQAASGWELFTSVGETQADRLGEMVSHHHAATFPDQVDRGQKEVNFSVLRRTSAPAILVELGFLSNDQERSWLEQEDVRQGHAEYIAAGILEFLGVSAKPTMTIEERVARLERLAGLA